MSGGDGLLACVRRAARLNWGGTGRWRAVLLTQAGPAHRRQVAAALLADEAAETGGRVFVMRSGDVVLLCPGPADLLRTRLITLHNGTVPPFTWMTLPEQSPDLLAYARGQDDAPEEPYIATAESDALPTPLLRQTTAHVGRRLTPLYQAVHPATPGQRLEAADLPVILSRLEAWTRLSAPVLQLVMTLPALLSPAFAALPGAVSSGGVSSGGASSGAVSSGGGVPLMASIPLLSAIADPDGWREGAEAARRAGVTMMLDGVTHAALALVDPAALGPDITEIVWSAEMIEGGPSLHTALDAIGRDRIVISGANAETALRWGVAQGIRRFRGRQMDIMLAGVRMTDCFAAAACTVRQCADRAAATSPAGRAGCGNPPQLSRNPAIEGDGLSPDDLLAPPTAA